MSAEPSKVISMRLALSGFSETWAQCRVVADYIARYAASDRFDPEGLATQISSFVNEVLELSFANHGEGTMGVDVTREEVAVHVSCVFPTNDEVTAAFQRALGGLSSPDIQARHRQGFLALLDAPDPAGAFVEMAAVHGVAPQLTLRDDSLLVSLTIPAE